MSSPPLEEPSTETTKEQGPGEVPAYVACVAADMEAVRSQVFSLLGESPAPQVIEPAAVGTLAPGSTLIAYLGDEDLARLIGELDGRDLTLGVLPHPRAGLARRHFGICDALEEALNDLRSGEGAREVDVFTCNGVPVLGSVVIGDPTSVDEVEEREGVPTGIHRIGARLRAARSLTLQRFALSTEGGNELDTVALGIVVVDDPRSSVLARGLIDGTNPFDGMLHAIVLSPRSLTEIAEAWIGSLLRRGESRTRPDFIGHVRTTALTIRGQSVIHFTRDERAQSAPELELRVRPAALRVLPGRHAKFDVRTRETRELFRIQGLPVGEARDALVNHVVPWRRRAATEEFRELFQLLRESAEPSGSFLMLMILSSLLATLGLFAGSGPVIIGAMILAPMMPPIISLAMGVLRQDETLSVRSMKSVALGAALAVGSSAALTLVTPLRTVNPEIAARLHPTLLDLGVAVISGVAGAYAHARVQISRSLAGVAIAVALVPPLAVSGIGIGWADWTVFSGATLLFLTNLAGIVLAAAITFLGLGFSPFHRARKGLAISLALAALVSLPLGNAFRIMVDEHRVVHALDGWSVEGVTLRDVSARIDDPVRVNATLLTSGGIDAAKLGRVRARVEERLGRAVILEAMIALVLAGEGAPAPPDLGTLPAPPGE